MREPKIVFFDLETIPNLPEALEEWCSLGNFPGRTMKATVTTIACCGYKIFGESQTHCINAWDYPFWDIDVNDDKFVCEEIYSVLHDADAIVTHNGRRFDFKHLQTRLMYNGLPTLDRKMIHVDTLKIAKANFLSYSNALGYLGKWLVNDKKMSHEGWPLWVKTHGRVKSALVKMEKYCIQDVDLLEKVFIKLLPFIDILPNRNQFRTEKQIMENIEVCPTCGKDALYKNGLRRSKTMIYQRYMCGACGSTCRTDAKDQKPRTY